MSLKISVRYCCFTFLSSQQALMQQSVNWLVSVSTIWSDEDNSISTSYNFVMLLCLHTHQTVQYNIFLIQRGHEALI